MGLFSYRSRPRANFTVISLLMVAFGLGLAFMSLRSMNYLQAEGLIIRSDVRGSGKGRRVTVRYAYWVNEARYDNDRVSYSLQMFRTTGDLLNTYPVGKRVPVYYSITDPSSSVLEKGFSFGSFALFAAGVLLFSFIRRLGP